MSNILLCLLEEPFNSGEKSAIVLKAAAQSTQLTESLEWQKPRISRIIINYNYFGNKFLYRQALFE